MPATNLSLTLTANNKIINDITSLFSTVNVTLATPTSHSLLANLDGMRKTYTLIIT
jgi:hypothetical protein